MGLLARKRFLNFFERASFGFRHDFQDEVDLRKQDKRTRPIQVKKETSEPENISSQRRKWTEIFQADSDKHQDTRTQKGGIQKTFGSSCIRGEFSSRS